MTKAKLKPGQSQLDWLWEHYSNTEVSNDITNNPDALMTADAVKQLIEQMLRDYDLEYDIDLEEDGDMIYIRVIDHHGTVLKKLGFLKGSKITKFNSFFSTQEDVDKGYADKVGDLYLVLKDTLGQEFYVNISPKDYIGQETDSIITSIADNKVASVIKINNPILEKSVSLKTTTDGIRADLVIDETTSTSISIEKSAKGISCHYRWQEESTEISFKAMPYTDYLLLPKINPGTLYFITDLPCIMFRGVKYASSTALVDYVTQDEFEEYVNNNIIIQETLDEAQDNINIIKNDVTKVQATIKKLEGDGEGSIVNIVNSEITKTLEWEILN